MSYPPTVVDAQWRRGIVASGRDLPFLVSSAYYLISYFAVGAILHASHQVLMAEPAIDGRLAWHSSKQRFGAMIGASFGAGITAGLFALLLLIPGVLRWLSYYIAAPIALHEPSNTEDVLKLSAARTHGHRASILGSALVVGMVAFTPAFLLLGAFGAVLGAVNGSVHAQHKALIHVVSELVVQGPLVALHLTTAVLYARCTIQHEPVVGEAAL